jgi:hypothetical protein
VAIVRSNNLLVMKAAARRYDGKPIISLDGDEADELAEEDVVYLPHGLTLTSHGDFEGLSVTHAGRRYSVNAKEVVKFLTGVPWAIAKARQGGLLFVSCLSAARVSNGNMITSLAQETSRELPGCRVTGVNALMRGVGLIEPIPPEFRRPSLEGALGWRTFEDGQTAFSANFGRMSLPVSRGPHTLVAVPSLDSTPAAIRGL